MSDDKLIFIISQPRAGSTFLQRLLSNNELVNTTSEPWVLLHSASIIKPELLNATFSNTFTEFAFDEYKKGLSAFDFKKIEKDYILSLYEPLIHGFEYVIDKTPRYWEIINEIPIMFPNAKIVVLKRNPKDVLCSIIKTWKFQSVNELIRFKRDLLIAPFELQTFLEKNGGNDNVIEVRYEHLIKDLPAQTKAIYDWLQIPYSDEVLDVEKNTKTKGVFGDPYQNDHEIYKKETSSNSGYQLTKKQQKFVNAYLLFLGNKFLSNYGYAIEENEIFGKSLSFEYFKTQYHTDHHWKNETTCSLKNKFLSLFNRI